MTNYIIEYYNKLESGEIITSKKVKEAYKHVIHNINHSPEYCFNEKKANKAIVFIESFCKHSKGKWAGQPIKLLLWQKAFISVAFGMVHKKTGLRQYQEVILIVGRKNGKSVLASAIANYMLIADGEAGASLASAATKKDQAKIIWEESKNMIKASKDLKPFCKLLINEIKFIPTGSDFKPLSSDTNSLDGLNLHGVFIDELHAISNMNTYDVLKDGMTARQQPLLLITSTNGLIRNSVFDIKYSEIEKVIRGYKDKSYIDERFFPLVYELDNQEEIWDAKNWIKANPCIDITKSRQQLETKVYKASKDSRLLNNLLAKDFNVAVTAQTKYFELEDVNNKSTWQIPGIQQNYYIGGFDLSLTTDLTSASILFKKEDTFYIKSMFWIPEDNVERIEQETNAPITLWIQQGLIKTCTGNIINPLAVLDWLLDLQERYNIFPYKVGYDPWGAAALVEKIKMYYGKDSTEAVRQGKKTLSQPMIEIKALFQANKINYDNNPVLLWNLLNVEAIEDVNGNIQPGKNRNDKAMRIDGFAGLLNAFTVYKDYEEKFKYMNA